MILKKLRFRLSKNFRSLHPKNNTKKFYLTRKTLWKSLEFEQILRSTQKKKPEMDGNFQFVHELALNFAAVAGLTCAVVHLGPPQQLLTIRIQ